MKAKIGFVGTLLAGILAMAPLSAAAQDFSILVVRSGKDYKATYIWTANCPKINVNDSKPQVLTCTLERNECKPGSCAFENKSTDQPPLPLTIGISSHNPTCGWVWDPYRYTYVYRCW